MLSAFRTHLVAACSSQRHSGRSAMAAKAKGLQGAKARFTGIGSIADPCSLTSPTFLLHSWTLQASHHSLNHEDMSIANHCDTASDWPGHLDRYLGLMAGLQPTKLWDTSFHPICIQDTSRFQLIETRQFTCKASASTIISEH